MAPMSIQTNMAAAPIPSISWKMVTPMGGDVAVRRARAASLRIAPRPLRNGDPLGPVPAKLAVGRDLADRGARVLAQGRNSVNETNAVSSATIRGLQKIACREEVGR